MRASLGGARGVRLRQAPPRARSSPRCWGRSPSALGVLAVPSGAPGVFWAQPRPLRPFGRPTRSPENGRRNDGSGRGVRRTRGTSRTPIWAARLRRPGAPSPLPCSWSWACCSTSPWGVSHPPRTVSSSRLLAGFWGTGHPQRCASSSIRPPASASAARCWGRQTAAPVRPSAPPPHRNRARQDTLGQDRAAAARSSPPTPTSSGDPPPRSPYCRDAGESSTSRALGAMAARICERHRAGLHGLRIAGSGPRGSCGRVVAALRDALRSRRIHGVTIALQNHHDLAVHRTALLELFRRYRLARTVFGFDARSPAARCGEDFVRVGRGERRRTMVITTNADYVCLPRFV